MKTVLRLALVSGLALGIAATPSYAAKEKAEKEAPKGKPQLSKDFQPKIAAVQKLIAEKKADEALAALAVAQPLATTPDDKLYVGAMRQNISKLKGDDETMLMQAITEQLDSGSTLLSNGAAMASVLGKRAHDKGDHATAITRLTQAEKLGGADGTALIFLADSYIKTGKTAEGMAIARRAIETEKKAGRKPPSSWYSTVRTAAYNGKLVTETGEWQRALATDYPTPENIHDMAGYYINLSKAGDRTRVDAFRLMRDSKSISAGNEYIEFADLLVRLKVPGEAQAVLKEGIANSKVKAGSVQVTDIMPTDAAIAADKASLNAGEGRARAAATGGPAANNAEAFMGYGDYAKAVDLYRIALQKGGAGLDVDETNLRLGMALLMTGQKAEAAAAFAKVNGPRAELAKYWTTWAGLRA